KAVSQTKGGRFEQKATRSRRFRIVFGKGTSVSSVRALLLPETLRLPLLNSDSSCRYRKRFDFPKATRRWIFPFWPASANGEPFDPCLSASETIVTGFRSTANAPKTKHSGRRRARTEDTGSRRKAKEVGTSQMLS